MHEDDWDFDPIPQDQTPQQPEAQAPTPPPAPPLQDLWAPANDLPRAGRPPQAEPFKPEPPKAEAEPAPSPVWEAAPPAAAPTPEAEDAPILVRARTRPKRRGGVRVAVLCLCCALLGGMAGFGGTLGAMRLGALLSGMRGQSIIYQGSGSPVVVDLSKAESGQVLTPAEVYAANVNSVVGITTQVTTNVWGQTVTGAASGSGFVLTADGYIVTNYHVIEDATSITVQFKNGNTFEAKLVGGEAANDVAVLKIEAQDLTPVRLGTSGDIVVGEEVVAIGNPLGEMTFSMTRGVVSALDKPLTIEGKVINVLQTDAAINSGNSGGPLFNMYGHVIGITNAKYSNNGSTKASIEGICFAIPIDDVKTLLTDIIQYGYVTGKPYAGAVLSTVNADEAKRYGRAGGAYVEEVIEGSPSEKAGLQVGDIITKMDDTVIDGRPAFMTARDKHKAGDTVTLTVDRGGEFIEVELTFAEQQPENPTTQNNQNNNQNNNQGGNGYRYDYGYGYGYDPFYWFGW